MEQRERITARAVPYPAHRPIPRRIPSGLKFNKLAIDKEACFCNNQDNVIGNDTGTENPSATHENKTKS